MSRRKVVLHVNEVLGANRVSEYLPVAAGESGRVRGSPTERSRIDWLRRRSGLIWVMVPVDFTMANGLPSPVSVSARSHRDWRHHAERSHSRTVARRPPRGFIISSVGGRVP